MELSIRPSHALICVDDFVDGKRVGANNGTLGIVHVDATCKKVLEDYMGLHASLYCHLPDSTIVTMLCVESIETAYGKPASDVSATQDCTVFFTIHNRSPCQKIPPSVLP